MKIQKIQQLCKQAKRIIICEGPECQWISDGYGLFPLLGLPRLNKDNIFAMFDIPKDKQGKIFFEERDELPIGIDVSDCVPGENAVSFEPHGVTAYGRVFSIVRGLEGSLLVDKKYLSVFDEDAIFFEVPNPSGEPYIIGREGMFVAGVIIPYSPIEDLKEWGLSVFETLGVQN